jgi:hypothetical protein
MFPFRSLVVASLLIASPLGFTLMIAPSAMGAALGDARAAAPTSCAATPTSRAARDDVRLEPARLQAVSGEFDGR